MFGELIDGAFQTIRRNAKTMFGSALVVQAIKGVLNGMATLGMLGIAQPPVDGFTTQSEAMQYLGPVLDIAAAVMGISMLAMVLSSILQGVMVIPAARSALNRRTGFKQMWSLARSRIWSLVGLGFVMLGGSLLFFVLIIVLAALILTGMGPIGLVLVIPLGLGAFVVFTWVYTKLMVAPAAVTVEELGVFAGLRRSWNLTAGNWWRIFGITLLVGFMVGVIAEVIQIPLSLASGGMTAVFSPHPSAAQMTTTSTVLLVVSLVVAALVGAVGFAFQTSVAALIYMDLRMRRDGLDVELLRLLETGEDPDGVPGRGGVRHTVTQSWPPMTGQGSPTG